MIWKTTTCAGFGRAWANGGKTVVIVGHYNPPGNVIGRWAQNIPRPLTGLVWTPTYEQLGELNRMYIR